MANKYLKHRFTTRETILLFVLLAVLLVGLFFGLVFYPIQARRANLKDDLDAAALERQVYEARKAEYDRMKKELDSIAANSDDTVMPETGAEHYRDLLNKINEILVGIDHPVTSSLSAPNDGVVKRTISLSFTVNEANKNNGEGSVYDKVHQVLIDLVTKTKFRCSMASLTLSPGGAGLQAATSITVSTTIEFFEVQPQS